MRVGERLAHYELLEELGRGGMGTVFRATDLNTAQEVALKVLPAELSLNPALLQRFRREVMTLRQLHHPGIVRILDVGSEGRTHYFSMEYVSGGSLERLLDRRGGRLEVEEALDIIIQLAQALDYAHTKNIIHRDIKPSNILLTEGGHPKLTDFGIAKVVEATRMTVTGGIVGTVDYMAPEQAEGRAIGPRTDIYSLGILLYRMTTGRLPFKGETPSEVIQKHRFSLVEPPVNYNPDMPENLSLVIEHMLEKDPSKRVASARQLMKVLQKIKSQMHPGDPAKSPTVYSAEDFVSPDRDTSVEGSAPTAARTQPAPIPETIPPGRRRRRPSYREPPDWSSRLWLLLGVLLILAVAGLPFYRVLTRWLSTPEPAATLLDEALDAERQGNYLTARGLYRQIIDDYPHSDEAEAAQRGLERARKMNQLDWLRRRFMADVRDAVRMGAWELARDMVLVMKRYWPEDERLDKELTRIDEMRRLRPTPLPQGAPAAP